MKEIQIPRKNLPRSSDPGTKRVKDSDLKNRKFTDKRQSITFSDVSVESTKDPMDLTPISHISSAISDSEAESFIHGLDLLSTPEICLLTDESPDSIDGSSTDRIKSISDLPASLQSLREEINELKKMISSVQSSGESDWIDGALTRKFRIMLLSFFLWAILAAVMVFVKSGEEIAYYGPVPT